jgi:hypothetical protein
VDSRTSRDLNSGAVRDDADRLRNGFFESAQQRALRCEAMKLGDLGWQ